MPDNQSLSLPYDPVVLQELSRTYSIADSASTGPVPRGQSFHTLDRFLSSAGERLERLLRVTGRRRDNTPTWLQLDVDLEEEELNVLSEQLSVVSIPDSDSTESGRIGPERTMDVMVSKAGRLLEDLVSNGSERLGAGPNAIMHAMLAVSRRHSSRSPKKKFPFATFPSRKSIPFHTPPSLQKLLETAIKLNYSEDLIENSKFVQGCRKLVHILKRGNYAACYLAICYLTTIICCYPNSRSLFLQLKVEDDLNRIVHASHFARSRDRDLLLMPSRRALACLSESEVLTTIKEFNVVVESNQGQRHVSSMEILSRLVSHSRNSDSRLLAARHLAASIRNLQDEVTVTLVEAMTVEAWSSLFLSLDPVDSCIYYRLLSETLFQVWSYISDWAWFWERLLLPLFRVCLQSSSNSHLNNSLIDKLLDLFEENSNYDMLAASISDEVIQQLQNLHRRATQLGPIVARSMWFDWIQDFSSPFFKLWGAFIHGWLFACPPRVDIAPSGRMPYRVIPLERMRSLCDQLVRLVVRCQCSRQEVERIAKQDPDCHREIIKLLSEYARVEQSNTPPRIRSLIDKLSSDSWGGQRPSLQDYDLEDYCIGIKRGICVDDPLYPDSQGLTKAYGSHYMTVADASQLRTYDRTETFLSDFHSVRWVAATELRKEVASGRYQPVHVSEAGREEYIGCIPDLRQGGMQVFSICEDLSTIPSGVRLPRNPGPLHVLVAPVTQDQSLPWIYWYSRRDKRLQHAISMQKINVAGDLSCINCSVTSQPATENDDIYYRQFLS